MNTTEEVKNKDEKPKMKRWLKITLIVGVVTLAEIAVVTPIAVIATQKKENAEKPAAELPSEIEIALTEYINSIECESMMSTSQHLTLLFLEQQLNGEWGNLDEEALEKIGLDTLNLKKDTMPSGTLLEFKLQLISAYVTEHAQYKLTIMATKNQEIATKEFFVFSSDLCVSSETDIQTFIDSIGVSAKQGVFWGEYDSLQTFDSNGSLIEKPFNENEIKQLKIDSTFNKAHKPEDVTLKYTFENVSKVIGSNVDYQLTIKAYVNDQPYALESKKTITSYDEYSEYDNSFVQAINNFVVPNVVSVTYAALDSKRTDVTSGSVVQEINSKPFNASVATSLGIAFDESNFPTGTTFKYDLIKKKSVFGEKVEYEFALITQKTIGRSATPQTLRKPFTILSTNINVTQSLYHSWTETVFLDENQDYYYMTLNEMNAMEAEMEKSGNGWLKLDKEIAIRRKIYNEDAHFWKNFPTHYDVYVRSGYNRIRSNEEYSIEQGNRIDYWYDIKMTKKAGAPSNLPNSMPAQGNLEALPVYLNVGVNATYEINKILSLYKIFENGEHTYDGSRIWNNYFFDLPTTGTRARPASISDTTIDVIHDILPESQPWIDAYNEYCLREEEKWIGSSNQFPSPKYPISFNVEIEKEINNEVFYIIKVSSQNIKDYTFKLSVKYNA